MTGKTKAYRLSKAKKSRWVRAYGECRCEDPRCCREINEGDDVVTRRVSAASCKRAIYHKECAQKLNII